MSNVISRVEARSFAKPEVLFFTNELIKIVEDAMVDIRDVSIIVIINDDDVFMKTLPYNKKISKKVYDRIVSKLLQKRTEYEAKYNLRITPEFIYTRIHVE